jgi:anti-anti-sigma factor
MALGQFFRTDTIDDILLLELREGISSLTDHSMLNELETIREQRRQIGFTKIVVDLAQAPFFGSSLLESIRVIWNDLQVHGGKLVLCNASPVGREVLEIANFDQITATSRNDRKIRTWCHPASRVAYVPFVHSTKDTGTSW